MTSTPKAAGPILRTSVIAAAVALAMSPCINAAYDITFDGIDGSPYATVRVFESQDRDDLSEDYLELIEFNEIRSLTQTDRTSLETAFQYVSDLLGPSKNTPLLYLLLSSEATNNASAGSESENTDGLGSQFFASVTGLKNFGDEAVGVVTIDKGSVDAGFSVSPLSVLPQSGPHMYLPSALIHELIHAYGMLAGVGYDEEQDQYGFGEELTPYEAGLRDVFGNRATGSKEFNIIRSESEVFTEEFIKSQEKPDQFNILFRDSKGGVSFAGDRVNELIGKDVRIYDADTLIVDADGRLVKGDMTNSVVGGIPINGLEIAGNKIDFDFEMSHLELQNSFLSHQNWRNWSTPMEAEMAFLQDLGFEFDRKRFFGTSLYDNDKDVVIEDAFTQRNEGEWVPNTPSTQAYAIGTHIYGSLNTVNVKAHQLADGTASIGVRVDGIKNTLTIENGIKVSANGQGGLGVAFTYGRNHTLTLAENAVIEANGIAGTALSFDFGTNLISDTAEIRGSYMRYTFYDGRWFPFISKIDALQGALLDSVTISGTVSATGPGGCAIYIAPNALVQKIELTHSAVVKGDIVSEWNAQSYAGQMNGNDVYLAEHKYYPNAGALIDDPKIDLTTELVLNGATYSGNILGADGIRITVGSKEDSTTVADEGITRFSGIAQVLGVTLKPNATLTGGGTFVLTPEKVEGKTFARVPKGEGFVQQTFVNEGKLISSPATGTTYIDGNYTQSENAQLTVGIDGEGNLQGLAVTGDVTFEGNGVNIGLVPSGYFKSNSTVSIQDAHGSPIIGQNIETPKPTYSFDDSVNYDELSKTLNFNLENDALTVTRQANAYSRVVATTEMPAWQRQIASILDANANTVSDSDAQNLIAALDFTTSTGIADTVSNLGGDAHLMSVRSHFALERLLDRTFAFAHLNPAPDGKSVWVQPFGGKVSESYAEGSADTDIAGLAGGVTVESQSRTVGWHLAATYMKSDDTTGGETQSEGLWFGGQIKDYPYNNGTWFIQGSVRLGVVNSETERKVSDQTFKTDGILYSLSASARVGADVDVGPVELSPIAGITATTLRTPSDTESGTGALDIDSRWYTSVRGQLGVKASTAYLPSQFAGYSWKWNVYAMYERELTDDAGDFKAGIKGMNGTFTRDVTFNDKNRYLAGVSLGLFNDTGFSASLKLDTEMTHGNGSAVTGSAQLRWKF